jgi:cytoskeletal protein CcmA (bactofilin family)
MGIFGGSEKHPPAAATTGRSAPSSQAGLSIIGAGMTVHGDVDTGGVVKIEGTVNGNVRAGQQVLVTKGGRIDGDVETGEAVIAGVVHGALRALERAEIQPGAAVEGDVLTRRILVSEGAVLNGLVRMGEVEEVATQRSPSPADDSSSDS